MEFNFDELKNQYKNGMLKDNLDCKNYILKYLFPLLNGTHALVENNEVTIIQKDTMNEVYLPRFPKDIKTWYKTDTTPKKLICDIHKPQIGLNYINVAKSLKHESVKYKSFSKIIHSKVDMMLQYVREVWANNNDTVYEYIIKWLANMVKGNKNKSCLYAKASQGVGKSTLIEFLRDHVIGLPLTCKGKTDHLKGQHNLQLLGRVLVYFEELQIFNEKEWYAIDSELKDLITDSYASYTDKYEKRFEAENINNYMIVTNSALKGVNGRRYLVVDINPKYLNDFKYYGNLRKQCFNDEVGKAFYCYLCEIDLNDFNSLDIPDTENKKELIAELLTPMEKFLKYNYVLRH